MCPRRTKWGPAEGRVTKSSPGGPQFLSAVEGKSSSFFYLCASPEQAAPEAEHCGGPEPSPHLPPDTEGGV